MEISFGPGGNGESWGRRKFPEQLPEYLSGLGLNGYEIGCGRGVRLAEKTPAPVRTAPPWAVLAAGAAACYALTPNRALRGRARADLPQYRFAAQINGGSLLNSGTLDGGFYPAAGVLPPCKYFCVTNMPLDDQWTDQQADLKAGAVEYVVALTGDLLGDFPQYAVIDRCSYDGGEGEVTWYLYQLQQ